MSSVGRYTLDAIVHADAVDYMQGIPNDCIDLIITSPPYDNLRDYKGYSFDFPSIAKEAYRVLKPGGVMVWIVNDATVDGSETLTSMRQAIHFVDVVGFKMHDTMIYEKDGVTFPCPTRYHQSWEYMFVLSKGTIRTANLQVKKNTYGGDKIKGKQRESDGTLSVKHAVKVGSSRKEYGVMPNVWYIPRGYMKTTKDKIAFGHPAMFPEALAERHILSWSNPGDVVLDFFMGSGTTAKMARKNGRHYIGCDIALEYVELARRRLEIPRTLPMFHQDIGNCNNE